MTEIAHSLYLFLSAVVDVFEEAAKLRAARRLWARLLHERYGVPEEQAGINIFVYTLGGALTAQEPLNNVVRVAYETLAAVLGGVQTLATSSYDEALGLPTPEAAHLALRTQQIVAHESGATKVVDPLGGSAYVEELTRPDRVRDRRGAPRDHVEHGGAVAALESGLLGRRIADASYAQQQRLESGDHEVVGVNVHRTEPEAIGEVFKVPAELQAAQRSALAERRARARRTCVARRRSRRSRAPSATAATACPRSSTPPAHGPRSARSRARSARSSAPTVAPVQRL